MLIREDLLDEIKRIFEIEELNYIKATKTLYGETLLLFKAEGRTITIEFEKEDTYFIYEVEEEFSRFFIVGPIVQLSIAEEETCLELDDICAEFNKKIIKFPGKAFDFTQELVLLVLEDS